MPTPLVRELVQDLRGVLRDDQPRLGYWDLAIASDTISDERLPPLYRRLFGEIPLGLADAGIPVGAGPCGIHHGEFEDAEKRIKVAQRRGRAFTVGAARLAVDGQRCARDALAKEAVFARAA